MGNTETHDFAPVRPDERRELNLSRKVNNKNYKRHVKGEYSETCLMDVPWGVRDAVSLYERMDISFNCLTDIPPEIPLRLPHLNHLNLSHNQISSLPESFGLLFHMRTVIISNNRLSQLPDSFSHLVKLEKLDISHNLFRTLPEEIGAMESLARLNISHNKLKTLPISLGTSETLKVLLARNNRFEEHLQNCAEEGSESILKYLRKMASTNGCMPLIKVSTNVFPRVRGNQVLSSGSSPISAVMDYKQAQSNFTNTPTRMKTPLLPPLDSSTLDVNELRDKIIGLIYGAAIGDAIGIATENMRPDECKFYYDPDTITYTDIVRDEHRTNWRQGDWTVDFDQFVIVLDSIIHWAGVIDELDFAQRLNHWSAHGFKELGDSDGFVVSNTITKVTSRENFNHDPHMEARHLMEAADTEEHPDVYADNGAVCRSLMLGIPQFHDLDEVANNAVRICKSTHTDSRCVASAIMTSCIAALILQGQHDLSLASSIDDMVKRAVDVVQKFLPTTARKEEFLTYMACADFKSVNVDERGRENFTYKPLAAGLAALRKGGDYRSNIVELIMLGSDSNTNACLAGGFLGAKVGFSNLPPVWVDALRKRQTEWLNIKINMLLDMMGIP